VTRHATGSQKASYMKTIIVHRLAGLFLSLAACLMLDSPAVAQQSSDTADKTLGADSDSSTTVAKPERRIVRIIGNTKLDVRQWPLLGKPEAKYVFVEMFDYTCPHCRDMHHSIQGAFKRYGKDLAVMALPVPLNASCNNQIGQTESLHIESCELANLAIAVWRVNPSKYHEYHDWLFEPSTPRTAAAARQRAIQIVDEDQLNKVLGKQVPQKFISSHVKLYAKAGGGSIPKMLFPNITLVGNIGTDSLCQTIERELGNQ